MSKRFIKGTASNIDFSMRHAILNRLEVLRASITGVTEESKGIAIELPSLDVYSETGEFIESLADVLKSNSTDSLDIVVDELYEFCQTVDVHDFCVYFRAMYFDLYRLDEGMQTFLELLFTTIFKIYSHGLILGLNYNDKSVLVEDSFDLVDLEMCTLIVSEEKEDLELVEAGGYNKRPEELKAFVESRGMDTVVSQMRELSSMQLLTLTYKVVGDFHTSLIQNLFLEVSETSAAISNVLSVNEYGEYDFDGLVMNLSNLIQCDVNVHLRTIIGNALTPNALMRRKKIIPRSGIRIRTDLHHIDMNLSSVTLAEWHTEHRHVLTISSTDLGGNTSVVFMDMNDPLCLSINLSSPLDAYGTMIALTWLGVLDDVELTAEIVLDSMNETGFSVPYDLALDVANTLNNRVRVILDVVQEMYIECKPIPLIVDSENFDYRKELADAPYLTPVAQIIECDEDEDVSELSQEIKDIIEQCYLDIQDGHMFKTLS